MLCLVDFFISSSASSADERIVGGRLGVHVDNRVIDFVVHSDDKLKLWRFVAFPLVARDVVLCVIIETVAPAFEYI